MHRTKIFKATRKEAYSEEVIPFIVQELINDEFIQNDSRFIVTFSSPSSRSGLHKRKFL